MLIYIQINYFRFRLLKGEPLKKPDFFMTFFKLKESSPVGGPLNKKYPLEAGMMRQTVVKRGNIEAFFKFIIIKVIIFC